MRQTCPFCNISMYEVTNEDYPNLETYLCYECGFHADTILMSQKRLYQSYQELYMRWSDALMPKHLKRKKSDDFLQGYKSKGTDGDFTEPVIKIYIIHNSVISFNDKQRAQHGL